jgi:hypothetical protein
MSSTGTTTWRSSSFRTPASTSSISRLLPATKRPISSIGTLRGRESDALEGLVDEPREPLEGEGEVGAALRPGDRVHLVEDHGLDPTQRLARLRRQEQEQRLGGRDEDVRRRPQHPAALLGRRVAGADGDGELRAEPCERTAEVPLDVVVERFERGDVEQAQPLARGPRSAGRCRGGMRPASFPSP